MKVYIVIEDVGSYSDRNVDVIKVFASEDAATAFIKPLEKEVSAYMKAKIDWQERYHAIYSGKRAYAPVAGETEGQYLARRAAQQDWCRANPPPQPNRRLAETTYYIQEMEVE